MIGSVSEWCWEFYAPEYYGTSPEIDPRGSDSESFRVSRGGSWFCALPLPFRCAHHVRRDPACGSEVTGFRVVRQP
jgi:formylglycine-generating enzyme required for sulfatase activity